jgi:hypothetical protein
MNLNTLNGGVDRNVMGSFDTLYICTRTMPWMPLKQNTVNTWFKTVFSTY